MPRQPSCLCGKCLKCLRRIDARERYQALSPDERRELVARRNPDRVRVNARASYERHKEKRLAGNKAYKAANREQVNESERRYRQRNPDKKRAHKAVNLALKHGVLVRPATCSVDDCERKPQAHHDDYSKPLEVLWLCAQHHADHHRGISF